ncbi:Rubrerythrin [Caldanaerovirga acetigignens]|uniref:Rubrerythrin n=1 Tax=Caldanaerovirga acetigignens TaxID=447595 RepID=A0A1M7LII1_9FIRM|nr:ferritin family protein [Caldanaerovirga acetigignens]SHM77288.1 Rubrerythrin [Caldanaerovirga acetigignens]
MKEILEKALKFEQEGYEYYMKISKQIINPLAKRLFESLAQQEKVHEEIIKSLFASNNFDSVKEFKSNTALLEEELKALFSQLEDCQRKIPLDHIEGYKLAMEMEKRGYEMYKKFHIEAKSEEEKKFFEALMKEELEHLNSLDNVYRFLTGTEVWYSEEESKVWNWMNT